MGEQVKTPQCGVFAQRYPTKQEADRAEQAQAIGGDYATGEGNEKSHLRNQKRKPTQSGWFFFLLRWDLNLRPSVALSPCRRGGRITCEQVKTVDNCFHDAIPHKARSIVREAVPNDRDAYATGEVVVGSNRNDALHRLPPQPKTFLDEVREGFTFSLFAFLPPQRNFFGGNK